MPSKVLPDVWVLTVRYALTVMIILHVPNLITIACGIVYIQL